MIQNRNLEVFNPRNEEISRERVEEMLRDIAFVLHMTRRVRDEIDTEKEAEEFAFA